jgi:hypothetical protein
MASMLNCRLFQRVPQGGGALTYLTANKKLKETLKSRFVSTGTKKSRFINKFSIARFKNGYDLQ